MTAGVKNAPKPIENAKPLADKIGDPKPVKELAPKVADKPEIKTQAASRRRPKPEPKPETKIPPKAAEKPNETERRASRSRIKLPKP